MEIQVLTSTVLALVKYLQMLASIKAEKSG